MVTPVRRLIKVFQYKWQLTGRTYRLEESLRGDMGISGDAHEDIHDSEMSLSNMTVLSDIPESDNDERGYEPGRFHLIGLGIYVQLHAFQSIYFSGRLRHGGTAPLAPPGEPPCSWACRCVVISYPSSLYVTGFIRQAFATLPFSNELLYLSPEMTGVRCDTTAIHS